MARARLASPTGVFCFRSHPVKVARVSSGISIWMAEWRPCISVPQAMWCRRHATSAITVPIFPSLFNGFKEHFVLDLDSQVTREVVVRPANEPEHEAMELLAEMLE